jgi:hypothetical protein
MNVFLKDNRVEINEPDNFGATPFKSLYYSINLAHAWCGSQIIAAFVALIASRREFITEDMLDEYLDSASVLIVHRFLNDPEKVTHECRLGMGCPDSVAAQVFAIVVFLSDGLYSIKPDEIDNANKIEGRKRFFSIAERLPLELQMLLCSKATNAPSSLILNRDSEAAFRREAQVCDERERRIRKQTKNECVIL